MTDAAPYWFDAALFAATSFVIIQLTVIGRNIMGLQTQVDSLTAQVAKIGNEVTAAHDALVAELASVKDQLANAGVAETVDLSGLTAAIQAVDDLNPDVVEQPAEEPAPVLTEDAPAEPVQDAPPF